MRELFDLCVPANHSPSCAILPPRRKVSSLRSIGEGTWGLGDCSVQLGRVSGPGITATIPWDPTPWAFLGSYMQSSCLENSIVAAQSETPSVYVSQGVWGGKEKGIC